MANRKISEERKALYYIGMVVMVIGIILFISVFVTGISNFGNFDNFEGQAKSSMARAFGGMALMVVGGILRGIGARGLAGSGVVLDPQKAREDVEPWSRMAGGIIKDAIDETGIKIGSNSKEESKDMDFDEKLRKLHTLFQDGIISEEEYQKEKKEILDNN
jgi:hypothetical protein